jgi:hypothetical protein
LSACSGIVWGFVHADVELTSNALRGEFAAKRWVRNIHGKILESEGDYFAPYKIVGNEWTNIVDFLKVGKRHLSTELLNTISKRLRTRTIFAVYERISGVLLYELCENGKVIERLHWDGSKASRVVQSLGMANAGFTFYSKLRKISAKELTSETVVRFFDSFLKSQGAFLVLETGAASDGKFSFHPEELELGDIERADYIGLLSECEVRSERVTQKRRIALAQTVHDCLGAHFWAFKAREEYKDDRSMRFTKAGDDSWRRCHQRLLRKTKSLLVGDFDPDGRWLILAARKGDEQLVTRMLASGYYSPHPKILEEAIDTANHNEHKAIAAIIQEIGNHAAARRSHG